MSAKQHVAAPLIISSLAALLVAGLAASQVAPALVQLPEAVQQQARSLALTDRLPVDPQVTVGRLPNGLRYYVRANKLPEKRAELRLAVNAGSVLEDNDQRGLAHFVEHMAFNGSAHFPGPAVVQFMESIGMRAGPSINAYTSFDETVYMLQVPTDRPELLEKALLVLEDWAHGLSLTAAEIDKERGVIIEEWRQGRGASARMRDKQFPVLLQGARYADRMVIGTRESLETFEHDSLRRFYEDWYRPDQMSIVAVGDFDPAGVESLIRKQFAAIPAARAPRPRTAYDVPEHPGTLYTVATDKEATLTQVAVYNKLPARQPGTVGAYREALIDGLASSMFSARLTDITRKPDAPFVSAMAARGRFVRTKEAAMLNAIPKEGAVDRALEALLVEAARVARFGFVAAELDRQKRATLRRYEQYLAEKDRQESTMLAGQLVQNFLAGDPVPGGSLEYALHLRFLPGVTLEEVNAAARNWLREQSRVVMVTAPEKPGLVVPDETKLAAVVAGAASAEVTAYADTVGTQPLMETLPEPGAVTRTREKGFGITEWSLSNGVTVVLMPTTFKQDEIVFRATSPGGTSLASDADFVPARTASQVVSPAVTGLGRFSATDLRKVLAGTIASVLPIIGETEEGLSGRASPKDLETMFQLINLAFTAPRADAEAFKANTAQGKTFLANQQASPAFAFMQALQAALTGDHPRARQMTAETIDQMNMEKSLAFYKERFADASDFTFVFVGSFTLDAMRPLVTRYLASLPSIKRAENWKDVGIRPPKGVVEKTVTKGLEPQSRAAVVYTGPFQYNRDQRVAIRALALLLQSKLRERVREDLGGTYGVGVGAAYTIIPREEYAFSIQFACNPERVGELVKVIFDEIEALKKNGPTGQQVNDVRQALVREFETNSQQNSYLLSQIYLRYQVPQDLGEYFGLKEHYAQLDGKPIWDAARLYLRSDNYVKVVLLPEGKASAVVTK